MFKVPKLLLKVFADADTRRAHNKGNVQVIQTGIMREMNKKYMIT